MSNPYNLEQLRRFLDIPRQTASGWASDLAPFRKGSKKVYYANDFLLFGVVKALIDQAVDRKQIRRYAPALVAVLEDIPPWKLPGPILFFNRATLAVGFSTGTWSLDDTRSLDKVVQVDQIALSVMRCLTLPPESRWAKSRTRASDDEFLRSRMITPMSPQPVDELFS